MGRVGSVPIKQYVFDYSGTNVTTAAWVQLDAAIAFSANHIDAFDSSGNAMYLGYGPSGSEQILSLIPPGGFEAAKNIIVNNGMRLVLKAVDTNTTTGKLMLNLYY